MTTDDENLEDDMDDDMEDEGEADAEGLASAIASVIDMYYLDEILVALAREIQTQASEEEGPRATALRADARALREAIGKLSGEA